MRTSDSRKPLSDCHPGTGRRVEPRGRSRSRVSASVDSAAWRRRRHALGAVSIDIQAAHVRHHEGQSLATPRRSLGHVVLGEIGQHGVSILEFLVHVRELAPASRRKSQRAMPQDAAHRFRNRTRIVTPTVTPCWRRFRALNGARNESSPAAIPQPKNARNLNRLNADGVFGSHNQCLPLVDAMVFRCAMLNNTAADPKHVPYLGNTRCYGPRKGPA